MQDHDDSSVELAIRASRFVEALASACGIKWIARGLHRLVSAIGPPRLDAAFLSDQNYYEILPHVQRDLICLWSPALFHLDLLRTSARQGLALHGAAPHPVPRSHPRTRCLGCGPSQVLYSTSL